MTSLRTNPRGHRHSKTLENSARSKGIRIFPRRSKCLDLFQVWPAQRHRRSKNNGSSGWSNYSPELRGPEMCFSPRFSGHHRSFWPLHDDLMRPITPAGASERSTASAMHDDNFRSTREVSRELGNQPSSSQFVACFLFYGQTIETAITTLYFQLWENSLTMNDGYSPYHESNTSYSHHTP